MDDALTDGHVPLFGFRRCLARVQPAVYAAAAPHLTRQPSIIEASVRSAALRAFDGFGDRAMTIAASVNDPSSRCASTSTSRFSRRPIATAADSACRISPNPYFASISRHRCQPSTADFPGYGKSPEPPASFSYGLKDQMRFVDAVLQAMRIAAPVILVVHDTGGMVGTAWAAANLGRLRGMVITNTVAFDGFPWFPIARQWGDASLAGKIRSSLGMAALGLRGGALFKRIFGAQCPQLGEQELKRFAESFATNRDAKRTTLRQFRQFMQPGFFAEFAAMRERILERVPCRVVWGDKDKFIPVRFAHAFGSQQVRILPDAGHWVALTAPEALAAEVEALG
jgi:pimeloyl-ACP methyl ester carboxylesterase